MVETITPNRYAAGSGAESYTLLGRHFSLLDGEYLGFMAVSNDDPTHYINEGSGSNFTYNIQVISDTEMLATRVHPENPTVAANYLGAIVVKQSREIVWINNSRPLV